MLLSTPKKVHTYLKSSTSKTGLASPPDGQKKGMNECAQDVDLYNALRHVARSFPSGTPMKSTTCTALMKKGDELQNDAFRALKEQHNPSTAQRKSNYYRNKIANGKQFLFFMSFLWLHL